LRWSSGCQLDADLRDATPSSRSSPSYRWTASSERWTPSDRNAGRDQIRTLDAISSERLDGFRQNLHTVALEVIVRPNPATPPAVLHDLDNIVRDYLIPGIVPSFGTVSDHRWTIDFEELRRTDPGLAERWGANPTPPPGTKWGVARYEAWRLPPMAGEAGFVSVALVADMDAGGDLIDRIDERTRKEIRDRLEVGR
jgi:hypothetical protein